jgi:hypothetical protein
MRHVGELAVDCLDAFAEIGMQADVASVVDKELSERFVISSLAMIRRLPLCARYEFSRTLPFSIAEINELERQAWQADQTRRQEVAQRLLDWADWGILFLNEGERIVDCTQYIHAVEPYLADGQDREMARAILEGYEPSIEPTESE